MGIALKSLPALVAIAASLALAACGGSSYGGSSAATTSSAPSTTQGAAATNGSAGGAAVVKSATNPSYGAILVNGEGMTLYALSAEKAGKFICTASSGCLGVWHPLTVAAGGAPSGSVGSLGTIKRPEGTVQVTYKGQPLYTFAQDHQAGEASGQGVKDVGTWSVVKVGSTGHSSAGTATTSSGGYSSGASGSGSGEGGQGSEY